jgi:hypothetical protein
MLPKSPPFKQDVPLAFVMQIDKYPQSFHKNDINDIINFLKYDPNYMFMGFNEDCNRVLITEIPLSRPPKSIHPVELAYGDWFFLDYNTRQISFLTNHQMIHHKDYGVSSIPKR